MDRYTRFANIWKAVGVTSRVRWHQGATLDRFNAMLVKRLAEKYGEEVKVLMEDVACQIGLEDGEKIGENLNIDHTSMQSALVPLETVALLTGIDSEVAATRSPGSSSTSPSSALPVRPDLRQPGPGRPGAGPPEILAGPGPLGQ
jgi:hypothetical protein